MGESFGGMPSAVNKSCAKKNGSNTSKVKISASDRHPGFNIGMSVTCRTESIKSLGTLVSHVLFDRE